MFLVCCLFAFSLYGQDTANINKTDASGRKQGVWKKYEKGKLVYEGQFKDNVPYGTFRYYHTNGKLKSTTDFIQGTLMLIGLLVVPIVAYMMLPGGAGGAHAHVYPFALQGVQHGFGPHRRQGRVQDMRRAVGAVRR